MDSGARQTAGTPRIPSGRGGTDAESEDKTGVGFGVCGGQGEVRKEYHWTSEECDPGKRR